MTSVLDATVYSCREVTVPKLTGLRRMRELAALSQDDLAKKSGVSRTSILRIERLESSARPSTVRKLIAALKCEPVDLIESGHDH